MNTIIIIIHAMLSLMHASSHAMVIEMVIIAILMLRPLYSMNNMQHHHV